MKIRIIPTAWLILLFTIFTCNTFAQKVENTGWLAWNHSDKFSDKFGLHLDVQFRSADDYQFMRNIMVRPGLHYYLTQNQTLTVGYLYVNTQSRTESEVNHFIESRIWEQYMVNHKVGKLPITHRLRLEQRFINNGPPVFSQRFRYFVRGLIPIKADSTFNKGIFVALQNEVFLNLQNKAKINDNLFDQNRAYVAAGYRFSKKIDLETGYLLQYSKGKLQDTRNHVWQLALYTRF